MKKAEIAGAGVGGGVGVGGAITAVSVSGTVSGLSAAGISSGLAAVGGTMAGGLVVVAAVPLLTAAVGYGLVCLFSK